MNKFMVRRWDYRQISSCAKADSEEQVSSQSLNTFLAETKLPIFLYIPKNICKKNSRWKGLIILAIISFVLPVAATLL
jgi:hypothetical protein